MSVSAASEGSNGAASSSQPGRGAFFVFEGLDRSGKTTQAKCLADYLEKSSNVSFDLLLLMPSLQSSNRNAAGTACTAGCAFTY